MSSEDDFANFSLNAADRGNMVSQRQVEEGSQRRWWWLSELGPHGYGKPIDGPHDDRSGVEEAAYLMARLGLQRDRKFVCAEIIETPVEAKPHGANEEAISTLNAIGLAPPAKSGADDGGEAVHSSLPPAEQITQPSHDDEGLIERLRAPTVFVTGGCQNCDESLKEEAANTISRLKGELEGLSSARSSRDARSSTRPEGPCSDEGSKA